MQTHNKKKHHNSLDPFGPSSGVFMQGDEAPPVPRVPKKKRKDIPPEEKKICLWVMEDGTACGKTFTKFDSLKRHVSEAHKGVRPYSCTLCGKTYGRRDYLLRHLRSHNETEVEGVQISKVSPTNAQVGSSPSSSGVSNAQINTSLGPATINFSSLTPHPPANLNSTSTTSSSSGAPTPAQQASLNNIKIAHTAKKRAAEDKKTCKWVLDNGTVCGRSFSKFDSLRRHVAELHKGIRPFVCDLCNKSYGRKDYLDRHIRNHANEAAGNLKSEGDSEHEDEDDRLMDTEDGGDAAVGEEVVLPNVVAVVGGDSV